MFSDVLPRDDKGFILTGEDLPKIGGRPRDWTLDREPYLFETVIPGASRRVGRHGVAATPHREGSACSWAQIPADGVVGSRHRTRS
jgi:hypothetical protein